MFVLQRIADNGESGFFSELSGAIVQFPSGADAAIKGNELNNANKENGLPIRYRVARYESPTSSDSGAAEAATIATVKWKCRERARLESGNYSPVPWAAESWYLASEYSDIHFPHISTEIPGKVAFTESDEKGIADIQLRMRAGKYLAKFFNDRLTGHEITFYASKVFLETGNIGLQFAATPDEIEHVYLNGPSSCMSHAPEDYSTDGVQPTRVYGAGDLNIAYLKTGESTISARAICWPDKKIYGTIYGDGGEYQDKFESLLDAAGYSEGEDYQFNGARILCIETDGGGYVCPYLDIGGSISHHSDSWYMQIGGDEYSAKNECGNTDDNREYCTLCESFFSGESFYLTNIGTICESCYENYSFYCEDCEESYHTNNSNYIEGVGRDVCNSCIDNYPACESCGDRKESDSLYVVNDGGTICQSCVENDYFTCEECDEIFANNDNHAEESHCCESCGDERVEQELGNGSATVQDERQIELTV